MSKVARSQQTINPIFHHGMVITSLALSGFARSKLQEEETNLQISAHWRKKI